MNLGVVLLPLRVFLGFISIYAGMGKLCDPVYFDGGERGSMVKWLNTLHPWDARRAAARLRPRSTRSAPGLDIAFLQVIVGVLTVLGLWQRVAAVVGALLSAALLVTVSWKTVPAYDAPDIIYLAAWSPLIIAGAPVYSVDGRLAGEAWRTPRPPLRIWDLRRRVLRRGALVAAVAVGLTLLVGSLLGGAVRDADRVVTVPGPGEAPTQPPPRLPAPAASPQAAGAAPPASGVAQPGRPRPARPARGRDAPTPAGTPPARPARVGERPARAQGTDRQPPAGPSRARPAVRQLRPHLERRRHRAAAPRAAAPTAAARAGPATRRLRRRQRRRHPADGTGPIGGLPGLIRAEASARAVGAATGQSSPVTAPTRAAHASLSRACGRRLVRQGPRPDPSSTARARPAPSPPPSGPSPCRSPASTPPAAAGTRPAGAPAPDEGTSCAHGPPVGQQVRRTPAEKTYTPALIRYGDGGASMKSVMWPKPSVSTAPHGIRGRARASVAIASRSAWKSAMSRSEKRVQMSPFVAYQGWSGWGRRAGGVLEAAAAAQRLRLDDRRDAQRADRRCPATPAGPRRDGRRRPRRPSRPRRRARHS